MLQSLRIFGRTLLEVHFSEIFILEAVMIFLKRGSKWAQSRSIRSEVTPFFWKSECQECWRQRRRNHRSRKSFGPKLLYQHFAVSCVLGVSRKLSYDVKTGTHSEVRCGGPQPLRTCRVQTIQHTAQRIPPKVSSHTFSGTLEAWACVAA